MKKEVHAKLQTYLYWGLGLIVLMTFFHYTFDIYRDLYHTTYNRYFSKDTQLNPYSIQSFSPLRFDDLQKPYTPLSLNYNASFQTNHPRMPSKTFLCKLNLQVYCNSQQVAEVIDLMWVVCPIYAPYQSVIKVRYDLHIDYAGYIKSIGMPFSTVEAIRRDRNQEYLLTKPNNEPYDIQLEIHDDGYLRENLLNVAARKIHDWEYFAWIDTHQPFENPYWWEEAIVKMAKYSSVQFFQYLDGLTIENVTMARRPSAIYLTITQSSLVNGIGYLLGNAFGIRKDVYDQIEYIYDKCIGGCCDCAYVKASLPHDYPFAFFEFWKSYTKKMLPWIESRQKIMKGSRAIVRGTIYHLSHEETFPYMTIMGIIRDSNFDVEKDFVRDENYTLALVNKNLKWKIEGIVTLWCFYTPIMSISFFLGSVLLGCIICRYREWRRKREKQRSQEPVQV